MAHRIVCLLLSLGLCLGLAGCREPEELPSRPEEAAFSWDRWEAERQQIACTVAQVDVVDTTFTHDETGQAVAELLGRSLIVYPRYAGEVTGDYTGLPGEYLLLTALLGTDGTTPGITPGAANAEVRFVAEEVAGANGRRQFITKEQVEYAARAIFGEEVELEHRSVPAGAPEDQQFRYYEEYGVYGYPDTQPIWYLPVLLDLYPVRFDTYEAYLIFVRYSDDSQNAFWGPGTEPIARWEIEEHANYHIEDFSPYTVTLLDRFGELTIQEIRPATEAP